MWRQFQPYFKKEVWLNIEGWKYIAINLVGNLFPVWFLLVIEFGNNGLTRSCFFKTIAQPYTYLVLAATFASSTLYLWIKKVKSEGDDETINKKFSILMIVFIILFFPILGFFLSKKECLESLDNNCSQIINAIYFVILPMVLLIYIYHQLYDFYELQKLQNIKANSSTTAKVNEEIKNLNAEL